jgi:hypothetical protein
MSGRPTDRALRLVNQQQVLLTKLIESRETNNRQLLFELQEITENVADVLSKFKEPKQLTSARQLQLLNQKGSKCNHKCPSEADPDAKT